MDTKTAYYDGNSVPRAQDGREAVGERNCLTDEGRPLGTGLQEQVPNLCFAKIRRQYRWKQNAIE